MIACWQTLWQGLWMAFACGLATLLVLGVLAAWSALSEPPPRKRRPF